MVKEGVNIGLHLNKSYTIMSFGIKEGFIESKL